MLKRAFDIVAAILGLILFSPLMIYLALRIAYEDKGPIFYRGVRIGLDGKTFRIFKFRSMVINAENLGGVSTANDDPRITKIGKFIRKYKLDELPQLFNVFIGNMSFVGPRPEVKRYTDMYTEAEKIILSVKPGITDWASLWNSNEGGILAGSKDPEKDYMERIRPGKLRLQMAYVQKHSFWVDLTILFQTFLTILGRPFETPKDNAALPNNFK